MDASIAIVLIVLIFIAIFVPMGVKVYRNQERGVILRMGEPARVAGPGLVLLMPFVEKIYRVNMGVNTIVLPLQTAISKDNAGIQAKATFKFKVINPMAAVMRSKNYTHDAEKIFADRLHTLLEQSECRELADADSAGKALQKCLNQEIRDRGLEITEIKLEDLQFGKSWK